MMRPMAIIWKKHVDAEQIERVADDADHDRADQGMADVAAPPRKLAPPMMTGRDGVEFEQVAVERRAWPRCGRPGPRARCRRRGRR
jgi:hypothetical protein